MKQVFRSHSRGAKVELGVMLGIVLVVISVVALRTAQSSDSVSQQAPEQVVVGAAATPIASATLPPGYPPDYPPDKAALLEREKQEAAHVTPPPKPATPPPAPTPPPPPTFTAGILETEQGPFSPVQFIIRNAWRGQIDNEWLVVYAGATKDPATGRVQQGALRLYTMTINARNGVDANFIDVFSAPNTASPLTITQVEGDVLQLRTDDGATFAFNVRTRQYQ